MGRLIDADEMVKRLQEWNTQDNMDNALYNFALHRIIEQSTAYDVDAVVEQLEKEKKKTVELCLAINDKAQRMKYIYEEQAFNRAIEIVKGGGVNG